MVVSIVAIFVWKNNPYPTQAFTFGLFIGCIGTHAHGHVTLVLSQSNVFIVRNKAKVRNRYNQVPHLTLIQDKWQKTQENITYKRAKRSGLCPAVDHKAARNRQDRMTDKHETQIAKKDPQEKHRLEACVIFHLGVFTNFWKRNKMYVMRWPFCWTTFLFDLAPSSIDK